MTIFAGYMYRGVLTSMKMNEVITINLLGLDSIMMEKPSEKGGGI
jgi:hypothetical protein